MPETPDGRCFNGAALRALRGRMKQSEIAERLGISVSAVSKWETGAASPTAKNIDGLTEICGAPAEGWYRDAVPEDEKVDRGRRITRCSTGTIESLKSWNDPAVQRLISSAKRKIIFVDTWFDEGPYFASAIDPHTLSPEEERLRFELYLLSELGPFGGQRLKEIDPTSSRSDRELAGRYKELFEAGVAEARLYLGDPSIELSIFRCSFMPGVRLMVIDDMKYVFSWFPVEAVSARNACFHVSADSPSEHDRVAVEHLRRQLAAIVKISEPVD